VGYSPIRKMVQSGKVFQRLLFLKWFWLLSNGSSTKTYNHALEHQQTKGGVRDKEGSGLLVWWGAALDAGKITLSFLGKRTFL